MKALIFSVFAVLVSMQAHAVAEVTLPCGKRVPVSMLPKTNYDRALADAGQTATKQVTRPGVRSQGADGKARL